MLDDAEATATTRGIPRLREAAPASRLADDLVCRKETARAASDILHDNRDERHGWGMRPHGRRDIKQVPWAGDVLGKVGIAKNIVILEVKGDAAAAILC